MTLATISTTAAEAASPTKPVTIVLVHGAFVDASGWKAVYDILTGDGYEVLIVQNPTITLEGDVAATKRVIAGATRPVLLVGHSYGGAVITEAGVDPKVKSLAYIAAFAPDVGESVFELATRAVPGESGPPLLPPNDGFIIVDPVKFPTSFAPDVDPAITRFMAAAQVPWGLGAVQPKLTVAAWRNKPASFMLTTDDRMVSPVTQRFMATRANANLVEIKSSHAVMLSHPRDVALFLEKTAAAIK
ncbi:pimeloyl-ACP methyl ester carboxylesterase [Sphingomonas kyeonggiensis]|uniref:Pimeloyl-ACP methyl ester carboxylesterase n=1 Tax=Sphingomonas kyeonggiensis TaxID=1268553 RepID=A0A7W7NUT5_9SPHN|nr:alpha/beta hydrolase [Sphingomonas kyeonggiensis]MBB4841292.1 pimeloyl-ACP methyl ester carboxylesterase [Sphingomonas kyeonggiensis]